MANRRPSELNELAAADIQSGDLFVVTDISVKESKKVQAVSLKTFINTGLLNNAVNADTASYLLYTGVPNGTASFSISSSYAKSSSYSLNGLWAEYSDTASYIKAEDVDGMVPSSSVSLTSSYVLYQYGNGCVEDSKTASYCENAITASFLWYVPGTINGTASFAISSSYSSNFLFDGTASYLKYTGIPNGTSSFTLNILNPEITSSYLILNPGRVNGSASYSITSSWASSSYIASQSIFLIYTGKYNGTSSYSMKTRYCDYADLSNYSYECYGTAAYAKTSSVSATSSICIGTASYALTASYCAQTASYAIVAGSVNDSDLYRVWGPYNTNDSGGSCTTTEAYIQNFIIRPPAGTTTTIIVQALLDCKIPMTTTDSDLQTVSLYLDYTEPGNTHSYGPVDTSRPNNYVNLTFTSGAFSISGYTRQSIALGNDWSPISGSWYRLVVRTTNGALIDVTRGVNFLIYTKPNTTVTKTAFPPF